MIKLTKNEEENTSVTPKTVFIRKLSTINTSFNIMKKQRIDYLWLRVRRISKIIGKFTKLSKDIKVYGAITKPQNSQSLEKTLSSVNHSSFIIMPNSKFKMMWNILISLLILYTAIFMPYQLCFVNYSVSWLLVDGIIDFIFFLDIILSFFSAYSEFSEKIVTSKAKIAKNYLKTWFLLDLVSCIPLEFFSSPDSTGNIGYNRYARIFRLGRFYKILRLLRMLKLLRVFKLNIIQSFLLWARISPNLIRVILLFCAFLFSVHVLGCFWYYIAKIEEFSENTWIHNFGIEELSDFEKYLASVYWVFTTLTTVGYGDIVPVNTNEKIFAMLLMGFGVGIFSYIIGSFSEFIRSKDRIHTEIKEKMAGLKEFSTAVKLPPNLFEKIRKNIKSNLQVNMHENLDHMKLIKDLPYNLRADVLQYFNKKIIENIRFFDDKSTSFLNMTVVKLKSSCYDFKENIFVQGEVAEEIYFVRTGRIHFRAPNSVIFRSYSLGTYFGDIEILENSLRLCSASVGSTSAELFILRKNDFLEILEEYPKVKQEVIEIAKIRKMKHEQGIAHVMNLQIYLNEEASLITESESSDSSLSEDRNRKRKDTRQVIRNEFRSMMEKKNKKLWDIVLDLNSNKADFQCAQTLFSEEKNKKVRTHSVGRNKPHKIFGLRAKSQISFFSSLFSTQEKIGTFGKSIMKKRLVYDKNKIYITDKEIQFKDDDIKEIIKRNSVLNFAKSSILGGFTKKHEKFEENVNNIQILKARDAIFYNFESSEKIESLLFLLKTKWETN